MAIDPHYADKVRAAIDQQTPLLTPAADAARGSGLVAALGVQDALAGALALRRGRAAAKYGPESDQAADADRRLTLATMRTGELRGAVQRAAIQPPDLPAGSAGVFGAVLADGAIPSGLVVVALNAADDVAGRSKVGADGAYRIVFALRAAQKEKTAPAQQIAVRLQITLRDKTLLTSRETLTLHPGDLVRRDLTLASPDGG